eukprot:TRINITY_DN3249_c0_g1_i1.p1 TRINITY_DN3249_c0_g1~~TRINITY_DN3249_c0_g1_i1.p1  ORF type:complete len:522 (-),score=104.54 TRINITY_DN3249_c0_g1_i1:250-1815(-)
MSGSIEFGFDNPKFSDYVVVLKSGTVIHRKVHVSKLTLSSQSDYFLALFTNDMKETREKEVEIELSSYEAALFYCIIKSLYTGDLVLPSFSELTELAHEQPEQPQTREIEKQQGAKRGRKRKNPDKGKGKEKEAEKQENKKGKEKEVEKEEGSEFLVDNEEAQKVQVYVDVMKLLDRFSIKTGFKNCVGLFKKERNSVLSACYQLSILGDFFQHIAEVKEYKQFLLDFIVKEYVNFDRMWKKEDFLQLPSFALQGILKSNHLQVSCEATVLQALRKWINHNPSKRGCYLPELLPLVRFVQISLAYLTDYVLGYDNFFEVKSEDNELFKFALGAVRYHSFDDEHRHRENSCFPDKYFPSDWLKERAGYGELEISPTIDWECDLGLPKQRTSTFYFRGVFYSLHLHTHTDRISFSIRPERLLTSGEDDRRLTNNNVEYRISAFNYQTNRREFIIQESTVKGVNLARNILQELRLDQNPAPYIQPNTEGKRVVRLFVSLLSTRLEDGSSSESEGEGDSDGEYDD